MTASARPNAQLSQKKAELALTMLLYGCTVERLGGFTAGGLATSYNVPIARAEMLLNAARGARL